MSKFVFYSGLIAFAVYKLFFSGADDPRQFSVSDYQMILSEYASMSKRDRSDLIAFYVSDQDLPATDFQHFQNCMGDFAVNKLSTLEFGKVVGWCEVERQNNYERFTTHFNELDSLVDEGDASAVCQDFVLDHLISPSTAKHDKYEARYISHGEGRYTIKASVDSQNGYGAMIRSKYLCEVKYVGGEWERSKKSWNLSRLEFED